MSSEYAGVATLHATITVLDDLDLKNAASVAVALQQLKDCVNFVAGGGTGGDFTDATFHGDTEIADGTFHATSITNVEISTTAHAEIGAGTTLDLAAGTILAISAGTDLTIGAGDDLTIAATDVLALGGNSISIISTTSTTITGTSFSAIGGKFTINATDFVLADNVQIGGGGADVHTVLGSTIQFGSCQILGDTISIDTSAVFGASCDAEFAGILRATGKFRNLTTLRGNSDFTADGTTGYEHILADNPSAGRQATLNHTGAGVGQRVRFNAQNVVTGTEDWTLAYGARTWFMRNEAGKTVIIEFVSDGTAWVVDDHAEGGDAMRDG